MGNKMNYYQMWENVDREQKRIELKVDEFIVLSQLLSELVQGEMKVGLWNNQVLLQNENFELEVRSERLPVQTLVIVKIKIIPKNNGIGTKVLNWLKDYAVESGFKRIVGESVNTEDGIQYMKRNGFRKCYKPFIEVLGFPMEGEEGNYELMLE